MPLEGRCISSVVISIPHNPDQQPPPHSCPPHPTPLTHPPPPRPLLQVPLKGVVSTVVISTVVLEGWSTKLDPDIRIMESLKVRALCTLCTLGAGIITLCS